MADSLLNRALDIVENRKEEKERQYGPFGEGMAKASRIATEMCNKEITEQDMYFCLVALKLSREAYNHKEDNILDAICYLTQYNKTRS